MGSLRAHTAIAIAAVCLPNGFVHAGAVNDYVAWQAALDRAMFSPGVIDGAWGIKSQRALREFQASRGLAVTGQLDDVTREALGVDGTEALATYTIGAADIEAVGPWPTGWIEKSQVEQLGYLSLAELVAARGHCSQALLARLNPGVRLDALNVGDALLIPNVNDSPPTAAAASLQVNLVCKYVRILDGGGRTVGLVNCSIAKHKEKRPSGRCVVKVVSPDPAYVFDPEMWPEVKGIDRKLLIPPGPRNPVGLFWIGLSLPGYGIHGTPEPEMIGKTGSHGCFRLANWDAVRLGAIVKPGVPVEFITGDQPPVASAAMIVPAGKSDQARGAAMARAPAARRGGPGATGLRKLRTGP